MDGKCLECLVNEFEERFQYKPARFQDSACIICLGPLLTAVVVVERGTWETLFHASTFDELGSDFKIYNTSKFGKVVGFPSVLLSSWMRDVAMKTREGKRAATFWDREFRSVEFCNRGSYEKDVGCRVRGWVFHT
jgi:hypothetical protein